MDDILIFLLQYTNMNISQNFVTIKNTYCKFEIKTKVILIICASLADKIARLILVIKNENLREKNYSPRKKAYHSYIYLFLNLYIFQSLSIN